MVDVKVIDGAVNGAGNVVDSERRPAAPPADGSVKIYAASLFLGAVLILGYYLWRFAQMPAF